MTIKTRILLLGLLAIASLLYILDGRFVDENRAHVASQVLLREMETAEKLSSLVHELQKERGISAGYLARQSQSNWAKLDLQRTSTNQIKARLDEGTLLKLENLATLADVRNDISQRRIIPIDSFRFYTLAIFEVLGRINDIAKDSTTPLLKNNLSAHSHLLYAKEYLAEIRGSLNEVHTRGTVEKADVAIVKQQLGLHLFHSRMFVRDASPDVAEAFRAVFAQSKVQTNFLLIQSTLSKKHSTTDADEWFTTASIAIDQLWNVEIQSLTRLRQLANMEMAAAEKHFLLNVVSTVCVSFVLIFLAMTAVYRLLCALNILLVSIEQTIVSQDFTHRIPLHGNDEMGVISRGFNNLLAIAERLICEKDFLASTDSLTGACNRYKFSELFADEVQRALRYSSGLALIMFDIDHFKQVNDDLGHGVGDTVLNEIAQLVQGIIRTTDVLARWGGEEFMILVPQNGPEAATALAEKLRCAIMTHRFACSLQVTASFGVSALAPGDTLKTLSARVDEALYRAKHEGRNRVCVELAVVTAALPKS